MSRRCARADAIVGRDVFCRRVATVATTPECQRHETAPNPSTVPDLTASDDDTLGRAIRGALQLEDAPAADQGGDVVVANTA